MDAAEDGELGAIGINRELFVINFSRFVSRLFNKNEHSRRFYCILRPPDPSRSIDLIKNTSAETFIAKNGNKHALKLKIKKNAKSTNNDFLKVVTFKISINQVRHTKMTAMTVGSFQGFG